MLNPSYTTDTPRRWDWRCQIMAWLFGDDCGKWSRATLRLRYWLYPIEAIQWELLLRKVRKAERIRARACVNCEHVMPSQKGPPLWACPIVGSIVKPLGTCPDFTPSGEAATMYTSPESKKPTTTEQLGCCRDDSGVGPSAVGPT